MEHESLDLVDENSLMWENQIIDGVRMKNERGWRHEFIINQE